MGVAIGGVAAALGGILAARHRPDTVLEDGLQFYLVLRNPVTIDTQQFMDPEN
jgi:hypothetical protein